MADDIATNDDELSSGDRSHWKVWGQIALMGLALGVLIYVGRDHYGKIAKLRDASLPLVGLMVVVFLATRFLTGQILKQALDVLGHSLGHLEAFYLTVLRGYAGMVFPRAGFGAAGVYLKVRHHVDFAKYGALALPVVFIHLCVIGVMGMAALGVVRWAGGGAIRWDMFAVFAVVAAIGLATLGFQARVPSSWSGAVGRTLRRMDESWHAMRRAPRLMCSIVVLQMFAAMLRAAQLYLALCALGYSPGVVGAMAASLLADLMFLVGVTPNALGLREAAIVYGAGLMGVGPDEALAAAVLDRVVVTLATIVVAQFALWSLSQPLEG